MLSFGENSQALQFRGHGASLGRANRGHDLAMVTNGVGLAVYMGASVSYL